MTEVTPAPSPEPQPAAPPAPAPAEAPPWGDDFSPEKAWSLVQNLRSDKEKLAQRPVLTPEQQQKLDEYTRLEQASKSEAQRQQEAIEAANRARDAASAEALRLRIALKHGIPEDDFGFLGAGDEEQLNALAERLAAKNAAAAQVAALPPAPTPVPGQRPVEQLRPGATPTEQSSGSEAEYLKYYPPTPTRK